MSDVADALRFVDVCERGQHQRHGQLPTFNNHRIRETIPPRQLWIGLGTLAVGCCAWTLLPWITAA